MWASQYGQTEAARVLMEHGASVDIKHNVRMILNRVSNSTLTWPCSVGWSDGCLVG